MDRKNSRDKKIGTRDKSPAKPAAKAAPAKAAAKDAKPAKKPVGKEVKPAASAKAAPPAKGSKPKTTVKEAPPFKTKDAPKAAAAGKAKAGADKVAAPPKEPVKRKRKSTVVRLKAFWGVFNQMLKRVAVFEYAERKLADKKAAELGANGKQPHFVQLVKEIIREDA